MLKNNKTYVKPGKTVSGLKKEIYRDHIPERSYQTINSMGSGYSIFDGPQTEAEHMNRPLTQAASGYVTKGEEFHWMANAAYNQSK